MCDEKTTKEKSIKEVQIRISSSEKKELKENALNAGQTISGYIRNECIIKKRLSVELKGPLKEVFIALKNHLQNHENPEEAIKDIMAKIGGE